MKAKGRIILAVLFGMFNFTAQASAGTWYIRSDGGSRYSAYNPSGQCNGKADAPYPGSGVNRACAFNDYRYLYTDGNSQSSKAWVIAGGDTVILRHGPWRVGYNGPNQGNDFGSCQNDLNGCYNPVIPAGTPEQPTRILGENYANCTKKTQLFGGFGVGFVLNLRATQNVEVKCLELTDHEQCTRVGPAAHPSSCSTAFPKSDYAQIGIRTDNLTANVACQTLNR